jgi:hypothetical protein
MVAQAKIAIIIVTIIFTEIKKLLLLTHILFLFLFLDTHILCFNYYY